MSTKKKSPSLAKTAAKKTTVRKKTETKSLDLVKLIQKRTEQLLKNLDFACPISVSFEEDNRYVVKIEPEEPSLLIGYHGQTLAALQLIINLSVQAATSVWTPIVLDIGDYRQRREDQLRRLALSIAQRVRFSGQPQSITRLSAAERRIVHLTLAEDDLVETFSEGEGHDRHLVIRLKSKS